MRNFRAKCKCCGSIVEVKYPREFKTCECGKIALDAGDDYYFRIIGNIEDFDVDSCEGFVLEPPPKDDTIFGREILPMNELVDNITGWFDDKGLSDSVVQMVKVQEEIGELAHEIVRGKRDTVEVVDALGDSFVTIIGMCHHLGIKPEEALSYAWSEIKDRKGNNIGGNFVKEGE